MAQEIKIFYSQIKFFYNMFLPLLTLFCPNACYSPRSQMVAEKEQERAESK